MDMSIIVAIKKYKYLLIKKIIAYHDNLKHLKDQISLAVMRMKRSTVGMTYDKSSYLLDDANIVNERRCCKHWNEISSQSLKNCLKK